VRRVEEARRKQTDKQGDIRRAGLTIGTKRTHMYVYDYTHKKEKDKQKANDTHRDGRQTNKRREE